MFLFDDLNERKRKDPRVQAMFKRLGKISFLFSQSVRIITEYPKKQFVLLVISITYSNLTTTEAFKISIKTKQLWI